MSKLYITVDGTDIEVEVIEYYADGTALVQALHGKPFDCDKTGKNAVRRCRSDEATVPVSALKIWSAE